MTKYLTIDRRRSSNPPAADAGVLPPLEPAWPVRSTAPAGSPTGAGAAGRLAGAPAQPAPAIGAVLLAVLRWLPRATSVVVAAQAVVVLLAGWLLGGAFGIEPLGWARMGMRPLTAASLLVLTGSLWALAETASRRRQRRQRLSLPAAGLVLLISLVTLVEYGTGQPFGLDSALFPTSTATYLGGEHPGRLPADGALALALLAGAHLALVGGGRRALLASQLLAVGAGVVGVTTCYSSVYRATFPEIGAVSVGGWWLPAALGFTVLSLGTVAARPTSGLTRVLTSRTVSAVMGRRMLAAALTVPFVLGWLPILAQRNALYGSRFGVAVLITGNALAFGLVSFVAANGAARLEAAGARAEEAAWQRHADLMALIDNTSAVIYMRDLDGRYRLVNREYERLFDVHRENLLGRTDHDLFPKEIADAFRANDLAAVQRGFPVQMEETAPGDDGPHNYITVKFPLIDPAGQPYAVCGISTDITDRTRAEAEVRRLNAELERRVRERTAELEASTRELDAFAYSVSHDLRAPLRSLDGFSQVLIEDYGDVLDDTGKDYLRRVQANTVRMAQMIDDLLDLSRASRVEFHRRPVDLAELARDVVADLREADPHRADTTAVTVADRLAGTGDPHLLRLVLVNLIGNAWKFTAKRPAALIEVGATESGAERVYFVRDNGAGFNMEYAGKLFEPFQRLHTRGDFDGSGLGLAIVQRILRRHGGRIWAEGEPDRGAAFYFTLLPLPEDEA